MPTRRLHRIGFVLLLVVALQASGAVGATSLPLLGSSPDTTVYPGGVVESKQGQCTFNFLFRGSDGRRYMGTAGHCIIGGGRRSWAPGRGPVARDAEGNAVGRFAYAALDHPQDFALVRLRKGVPADPQMCEFGGPTGINNERTASPTILQFCGRGMLVGDLSPARTGIASSMANRNHVFMETVALPGDSGSGVTTTDGRAVGVLVTVGLHLGELGTDGVDAGLVGVTRLKPQLRSAEDALGFDLRLIRAALL